jgi:isopropylmalate/homocitrate/citramalate synthase
VRAKFVGQPPAEIVMGKGSGIDSIKAWLADMGIEASDEDALKMTAAVKAYSLKNKRLLTEMEFRKIAEDVKGQRAAA